MVIIPHPTEQIKLIKFQKQLISELNDSNTIYYSFLPLWIELNSNLFQSEDQKDLKLISKKITSIDLIEILNTDKDIGIKIIIKTDSKEIECYLPLLKLYKGPSKKSDWQIPVKKIKIFRLGIPEDFYENSKAIKDFVWCKL